MSRLSRGLPGPFDRDRRRDLNTFGGSPDTPVHQAIRGTKLGVGCVLVRYAVHPALRGVPVEPLAGPR